MTIPGSEQLQANGTLTPPAPPSAPRLHFIDGLRGIAMLMVLFYHCWLFGGAWTLNLPVGSHSVNLAALLNYGHAGVNLFLVLSGFCLYWPFVKGGARREPTLWEFAKKRCRRILPPYYVALILCCLLPLWQALHDHSIAEGAYLLKWLGIHALMAHNLRPDYVWNLNGSLWSLGLEFDLYILFPILVGAYRRFNARGVLITVLAVATTYRLFLSEGHYIPDFLHGYVLAYSVFGRCFEFALGMFAAILVARWHAEQKSPVRWSDGLLLAGVVVAGQLYPGRGEYRPFMDATWGLLFATLLVASCRQGTLLHRALSFPALVSVGVFSYSVYLIHLPLVMLLSSYAVRHFSNAPRAMFELFLVVPLMLGAGYLFHLAFERPFMNAPRSAAKAVRPVAVLEPPLAAAAE